MHPLVKTKDGILLKAYVQPRASKSEVAGLNGDAVKIRLTAPPVEGAANRMCLKFIAKLFKIPVSQMTITSGRAGRHKTILYLCPASKRVTEIERLRKELTALLKI